MSRVPWLGIVDGDPCLASSVGYGSWGRGMPGPAAAVDQSEAAELRGRRHGGVPMTVGGGGYFQLFTFKNPWSLRWLLQRKIFTFFSP